jgi:hypothetical protein
MIKLFLITLLYPLFVFAKPIKVAVIDTGYELLDKNNVSLCEGLHADITNKTFFMKNPPSDFKKIKHGTNVSWLIHDQISKENLQNYCIIVIKYFGEKGTSIEMSAMAIKYAIDVGANVINYSGGGLEEDPEETKFIKKALDLGIIFVASAGNEGKDLSKQPYFPALADPRVIVVGNKNANGEIEKNSNFGKAVDVWEIGVKRTGGGVTLTGTSQATAVTTGKLVNDMLSKHNKPNQPNQCMIKYIDKDTKRSDKDAKFTKINRRD